MVVVIPGGNASLALEAHLDISLVQGVWGEGQGGWGVGGGRGVGELLLPPPLPPDRLKYSLLADHSLQPGLPPHNKFRVIKASQDGRAQVLAK